MFVVRCMCCSLFFDVCCGSLCVVCCKYVVCCWVRCVHWLSFVFVVCAFVDARGLRCVVCCLVLFCVCCLALFCGIRGSLFVLCSWFRCLLMCYC